MGYSPARIFALPPAANTRMATMIEQKKSKRATTSTLTSSCLEDRQQFLRSMTLSERAKRLIKAAGIRLTQQRMAVLEAILEAKDHPTAGMIFERARQILPVLSLATVYNCLDAMAEAKLINQLRFDNGPTRYCSNEFPHAHVIDAQGNKVLDIFLKQGVSLDDIFELPQEVDINSVEIYLHGAVSNPA